MKIKKFEITNYKGIKGKKSFNADGCSFFLVGKNGAGKSSAGKAIIDIIKKRIAPKPIATGEYQGGLEFETDTGMRIITKFQDGKNPKTDIYLPGQDKKVSSPA